MMTIGKITRISLSLHTALLICGAAASQPLKQVKKTGKIIFITPQNIYVRFGDTGGIKPGDTLYADWRGRIRPVMTAKYMSSQSCAGPIIEKVFLKVGDRVFAFVNPLARKSPVLQTAGTETDTSLADQAMGRKPISVPETTGFTVNQRVYGGFTVNSFSNFSNYVNSADIQRWNYSLNLNADNIGGSRFWFSNYMNYSYLGSEWKQVLSSPLGSLRVYDLALAYKASDLEVWAGRHINYDIAGVGPVDGVQGEGRFGSFSVGAVAGSRPDFYTLGFNPKLLQFGAYVTDTDTLDAGTMRNTLGLFQQFNASRTDRRFVYFQHNSNLFRNFNFYGSGEVDLFSLVNGKPRNSVSLTDLYFSTQYTPVSRLSLNISYSGQRNVIYYQTFGSTLDSLLESENYLRNNVRFAANFRPFPYTFIMLGTGYSFQQGDITPTRDAEITLTESNIPFILISASVTYNRIISSYLNGSVYGVTISKYIPLNSTSISIGFSRPDYDFGSGGSRLIQFQPNVNLTTQLFGNLYLNLYYQGTYSGPTSYGAFMGGLTERF